MKTKLFAKIFSVLMLCLALAPFVQANSVSTFIFYDSTDANSLTVNYGDIVGFISSSDSILENSMTIRIDLLDSSGNVVESLVNKYTTQDEYSVHYTFGSNIYSNPGDYTIRSVVTAESGATSFAQKSLEILPVQTSGVVNILSTPIVQVSEGAAYNYQILATTTGGTSLTYSLDLNPSWISIDTNTGLVSGTAPMVNSNTVYMITARAVDNLGNYATQAFPIYVLDTAINDITAPTVVITSPLNGDNVVGTELITYTDDELTLPECSIDGLTWVSCISGLTTLNSVPGFLQLPDGAFTLYLRDADNSGNTGTTSAAGIIKNTNSAPVIVISNPTPGTTYDSHRTQLVFTATDTNLQSCWYSLDNGVTNNTISCTSGIQRTIAGISSVEGSNMWTVYAMDTTGQVGSASVGFTINLSVENLGSSSRKIEYVYTDADEENYLEQTNPEKEPVIDLTQEMKKDDSVIAKFLRGIIGFFKALFGF